MLTRRPALLAFACTMAMSVSVGPIAAQTPPVEPPSATGEAVPVPPSVTDEPAPFDAEVARLATVLGALHYLRNICGESGNDWRTEMDAVLTEGRYEGERRRRMTAAFNDGYRAFSNTYFNCTPRAAEAAESYRREGAALAARIVTRYQN